MDVQEDISDEKAYYLMSTAFQDLRAFHSQKQENLKQVIVQMVRSYPAGHPYGAEQFAESLVQAMVSVDWNEELNNKRGPLDELLDDPYNEQ